jgi:hypothetical protein
MAAGSGTRPASRGRGAVSPGTGSTRGCLSIAGRILPGQRRTGLVPHYRRRRGRTAPPRWGRRDRPGAVPAEGVERPPAGARRATAQGAMAPRGGIRLDDPKAPGSPITPYGRGNGDPEDDAERAVYLQAKRRGHNPGPRIVGQQPVSTGRTGQDDGLCLAGTKASHPPQLHGPLLVCALQATHLKPGRPLRGPVGEQAV